MLLDGSCMSQKQFNPIRLDNHQLASIVDLLLEAHGNKLTKTVFADLVLLLLEDVSGFECVSDSEAQSIINKLWSLYHDQTK